MEIMTKFFDKINIDEDNIIEFPQALPGFPEEEKFALLPLNEDSPFIVMQSVNTDKVAFLTIEPGNFIKDYEFEIDDNVVGKMKIYDDRDVLVLSIVTIRDKLENMTVNLAAPLLINLKEKLGKQIILDQSDFPLQYKLFADKEKELVK